MKKWIILYTLLSTAVSSALSQQIDSLQIQQSNAQTGQSLQSQRTEDSLNESQALIDTIPLTDGFYQANKLEDAVPFAFPEIDRKNIRFYKRVWRDIDLNDEANYIYAIPGNSLMEVIMKAIEEGKLTPYSPQDDAFENRMSASEGIARFADSVLVPIFDDQGNQIDAQMTLNEFNPERVRKFRIKEDIFFDKQRGRLETRIIGVAPLMDINSSAELAESIGSTPAFWLYFPQLRYALVKVDVSDPDRGLYDMTMDDLFVQRKFNSQIVRESSPGMLQRASMNDDGQLQTENPAALEEKLESYKKRLWTTPKGVDEKQLQYYQEQSINEQNKQSEEQQRQEELQNDQREINEGEIND